MQLSRLFEKHLPLVTCDNNFLSALVSSPTFCKGSAVQEPTESAKETHQWYERKLDPKSTKPCQDADTIFVEF